MAPSCRPRGELFSCESETRRMPRREARPYWPDPLNDVRDAAYSGLKNCRDRPGTRSIRCGSFEKEIALQELIFNPRGLAQIGDLESLAP